MALRINRADTKPTVARQHREIRLQQAAPEKIRTERVNNKDFLVVPAIGLVEGVLQAATAPSPEFVGAEDILRSAPLWNGRPVTLGHPMRDNRFVSVASAPDVFFDEGIGFIFNTSGDDGKLKFDLFLDLEALPQSEKDRLESGQEVEVSTGFFADISDVSGEFNGRAFSGRLTNIGPDHFAVLGEGDIGACSVADGCGTPRVNRLRLNASGGMDISVDCACGGKCSSCVKEDSPSDIALDNQHKNNESQKDLNVTRETLKNVEAFISRVARLFTGERKMDEKIKLLIDAGLFEEGDREYLASLDEKRIDAFLAATKPVVAEDAPEPAPTPAVAPAPAVNSEAITITAEQKAVLDRALAAEKAEKQTLVDALTSDKSCPFDKAALSAKSIDELKALSAWVKKEDAKTISYAGRGGPVLSDNVASELPWRKNRIFASKTERAALSQPKAA